MGNAHHRSGARPIEIRGNHVAPPSTCTPSRVRAALHPRLLRPARTSHANWQGTLHQRHELIFDSRSLFWATVRAWVEKRLGLKAILLTGLGEALLVFCLYGRFCLAHRHSSSPFFQENYTIIPQPYPSGCPRPTHLGAPATPKWVPSTHPSGCPRHTLGRSKHSRRTRRQEGGNELPYLAPCAGLGDGEVIVALEVEPELRLHAKIRTKPKRRVRRDRPLPPSKGVASSAAQDVELKPLVGRDGRSR